MLPVDYAVGDIGAAFGGRRPARFAVLLASGMTFVIVLCSVVQVCWWGARCCVECSVGGVLLRARSGGGRGARGAAGRRHTVMHEGKATPAEATFELRGVQASTPQTAVPCSERHFLERNRRAFVWF